MTSEAVQISLKCDETLESGDIHFVPCQISVDTKSNHVKNYFHASIFKEENADDGGGVKVLHGSLRGRPLVGVEMNLPKDYQGILLEKDENEENIDLYKAVSKFQSLTYWNLDSTPCMDDKFAQALKWVKISKVKDVTTKKSTKTIDPYENIFKLDPRLPPEMTLNVTYRVSLKCVLAQDNTGWMDKRYRFDASHSSPIHVPSKDIRKPELTALNRRDVLVSVNNDGQVTWNPAVNYFVPCKPVSTPVNGTKYSVQTGVQCDIKLSHWTYNGYRLDLNFETVEIPDQPISSSCADVTSASIEKNVVFYSGKLEPFAIVKVQFKASLSVPRIILT